jgi:hypothetical protein
MSVPTTNAMTAAAPAVIEDAPRRGLALLGVRVLRASDPEWDDGQPT